MIKDKLEKLMKLDEKTLNDVTFGIFLLIFLLFCLGLVIGNIIGHYGEQIKITDKLIELSEKENNLFPDNNYFKINNQIYAINKINTSYMVNNELPNTKNEIDNLLYNGIYGWFCDDDSSYDPAISDVAQLYIDRKCHLISIDIGSVNRTYYIKNGWD